MTRIFNRFVTRFIFLIIISQSLLLIVSGILLSRFLNRSVMDRIKATNVNECNAVTDYIDSVFNLYVNQLRIMAAMPAFTRYDKSAIKGILRNNVGASLFLNTEQLFVIDPDGNVVVDNSVSTPYDFESVRGDFSISRLTPPDPWFATLPLLGTIPRISVAVPISSPLRSSGCVIGQFSLQRISRNIQSRKFTDFGRIIIADRDGTIVIHPDSELIHEQAHLTDIGFPSDDLFYYATKSVDIISTTYGGEYFTAFSLVENKRFGVFVLQGKSDATDLLKTGGQVLYLVLTLLFFVTLGLSIYISFMLISPLNYLIRRIAALTSGNETTGFAPTNPLLKRNDEIGVLFKGFNDMMLRIERRDRENRELNATLEQEVLKRTTELRDANQELRRINDDLFEKNQFKSKYLANMSHEIRTPLNSILGNIQLLLYQAYDPYDDILEINDEIAQALEKGTEEINDDRLERLRALAVDYRTTIFNNGFPLETFYSHRFRSLILRGKDDPGPLSELFNQVEDSVSEIEQLMQHSSSEIKKNLKVTHDSGEYLLNLINSILDISRIEAGKMVLILEEVAIRELLELVMQQAAAYCKSRNKTSLITLTCDIEESVPVIIECDRDKMIAVLLNLLSNSIKFTSDGSVTLTCRSSADRLFLTVEDTGVGIPESEYDLIFTEFGRTSRTETLEGTGLGLALSRKLVQMHGGSIIFTSAVGEGTTFTVSLPVRGR
jgi:signal transduction histidine kinase